MDAWLCCGAQLCKSCCPAGEMTHPARSSAFPGAGHRSSCLSSMHPSWGSRGFCPWRLEMVMDPAFRSARSFSCLVSPLRARGSEPAELEGACSRLGSNLPVSGTALVLVRRILGYPTLLLILSTIGPVLQLANRGPGRSHDLPPGTQEVWDRSEPPATTLVTGPAFVSLSPGAYTLGPATSFPPHHGLAQTRPPFHRVFAVACSLLNPFALTVPPKVLLHKPNESCPSSSVTRGERSSARANAA